MAKKQLTANDILNSRDFELEKVEAWGGIVYVRTMSERDYMEWIKVSREGEVDASMDLLVRTMCDADGDLLFNAEHINSLAEKSVRELNKVVEAALKINGLKIKDEEELVGELKKSDSHSG